MHADIGRSDACRYRPILEKMYAIRYRPVRFLQISFDIGKLPFPMSAVIAVGLGKLGLYGEVLRTVLFSNAWWLQRIFLRQFNHLFNGNKNNFKDFENLYVLACNIYLILNFHLIFKWVCYIKLLIKLFLIKELLLVNIKILGIIYIK